MKLKSSSFTIWLCCSVCGANDLYIKHERLKMRWKINEKAREKEEKRQTDRQTDRQRRQ